MKESLELNCLRTVTTLEKKGYEIARTPTEGKCFEVNYQTINHQFFEEERVKPLEKSTLQLIREAFKEVEKNPQKYAEPFFTYIPIKDWEEKNGKELEEKASILGDYNGDWVEQALEWAQRINNGESWEDICIKFDTIKWHRWVIGPDGERWLVGLPANRHVRGSACFVYRDCYPYDVLVRTVPFVVIKKQSI